MTAAPTEPSEKAIVRRLADDAGEWRGHAPTGRVLEGIDEVCFSSSERSGVRSAQPLLSDPPMPKPSLRPSIAPLVPAL